MSTASPRKEAFREGASEVTSKLRADVSNITKVRRFVTLSHFLPCSNCDGTGKQLCSGCGGEGKQKVVWNEGNDTCLTCEGTGRVTCSDCFGKGRVENTKRKWILIGFAVGGLAWLTVLYRLVNPLPEQQAKYLNGGGGGGGANVRARGPGRPGGTNSRASGGGASQPGDNNGDTRGSGTAGNGRAVITDPLTGGGGGR